MKVFVSWSGPKSGDVAQALHDWLPSVLHAVTPFISSRDIRAGTRWQAEIAAELDDTDFGLICVTRQNQSAEWLNFEAGALATSVDSSRVVPIAVDLSLAEIPNPLGQFQATTLGRADIADVLKSMNEACSAPISEENLGRTFGKWWPDLDAQLKDIAQRDYGNDEEAPSPARTDRDLLEEVLNSVRGLARVPSVGHPRPIPEKSAMDEVGDSLDRAGMSGSIIADDEKVQVYIGEPMTSALAADLTYLAAKFGIVIEVTEGDADKPSAILGTPRH